MTKPTTFCGAPSKIVSNVAEMARGPVFMRIFLGST